MLTLLTGDDNSPHSDPAHLWEAVGRHAQLREQETHAAREGNLALRRSLEQQRAVTWLRIRAFAEQLEARGEAPPGLVERLRVSLQIPFASDLALRTAQARLASRAGANEEYRLAA